MYWTCIFHNLDSIGNAGFLFRLKAWIGQPEKIQNILCTNEEKQKLTHLAISHKATTMPKLPKTENITISLILGFQNLISEKEMIKYLFNGRYGMNIKWSRSLCWSLTEALGGGMWSSAGRIFIIVNIVTWSQPVHHALKWPFL